LIAPLANNLLTSAVTISAFSVENLISGRKEEEFVKTLNSIA
jgi:hypothetical protein